MRSLEIPVGNQNKIDVSLEPDLTTPDEVVVVEMRYGSVKKSDLSGSVATLGADEIRKIPFSSAARRLQEGCRGERIDNRRVTGRRGSAF